jgi:apolipoprotein N-acyltransferase
MIEDLLLPILDGLLDTIGVEGVSAMVLFALLLVATWAHRAAKWGGRVAGASSTATHDLKVTAVILAALLLLGIASIDVERSMQLASVATRELGSVASEWLPIVVAG